MTKRIYGDDGQLTRDAAQAFNIVDTFVKEALEALEQAGFNAREAALAIQVESYSQSVMIMGRQRRARTNPAHNEDK